MYIVKCSTLVAAGLKGQNDKNLRKAVSNGAVSYADPTIPNSAGSSLNEADIKFNQDGKLDKNILYTVKGVPIFGCDGNISDQFRSAMYKAVAMVATENGMRLPNESLCTVAAFKIDGTTTFDIRFWTSSAEMDSCYRNNRCEFNTITNLFVAGSRANVTVTNVPPNKQVNACIDLKTKVHKKGFCD